MYWRERYFLGCRQAGLDGTGLLRAAVVTKEPRKDKNCEKHQRADKSHNEIVCLRQQWRALQLRRRYVVARFGVVVTRNRGLGVKRRSGGCRNMIGLAGRRGWWGNTGLRWLGRRLGRNSGHCRCGRRV